MNTAAGGVVNPAWGPWLALISAVGVAVVGGLVTLATKRLSKAVDSAQARKTTVEADNIELNMAREMLGEFRTMYADSEKARNELIEKHSGQMAVMQDRMTTVTERQMHDHDRLTTLLGALSAHSPWDQSAWQALRAAHPEWPPPPPVDTTAHTERPPR